MPIVSTIAKFFVALNSNTRPAQVGLGVAFAFLLGIVPFTLPAVPPVNLLWVLIFVVTFFLKINNAVESVFLLIFKLIAPLLYPLTSVIGRAVLTLPALHGAFTALNNIPFVPFTFFNSPLVMGGLALGLALFVPLTAVFMLLLKLYREKVRERIANSKFMKGFLKIPLVNTLHGLFDKASTFYQGIKG